MSTPAPDAVKRLVDRFDQNRKVFLSGDYKEEQLRAEFLNPFFTALGWDMDNRASPAEIFKPVIRADMAQSDSTAETA
jgi:predicted type IV restriction endonuclease